jgi:uroporphyrinogen decarboxylase
MGVNRRLLPGSPSYREWANDPKLFAASFIEGQKYFDFDFAIGLMDLSVMAADLGAHVRMDAENTPFVDGHIIHGPEDYEKLAEKGVPDIHKGRCGVLLEGTKLFAEKLKGEVITAGFIEGPLLALSQTASAERMFMDMFESPSAVHKMLELTSEMDSQLITEFAKCGVNGLCWDYLWASYSCLGDDQYEEFEGQYALKLNKQVQEEGMAVCIHSCADLPHLDYQINTYKPAIFSMGYYPLIPGSKSPTEIIDEGYTKNTLFAGVIDPQLFVRGTVEKISGVTKDLCQEVKTALCKNNQHSRWVISSNCEVPPDLETKLDNISAVVNTAKEYGAF